jgi:hypothetical protein
MGLGKNSKGALKMKKTVLIILLITFSISAQQLRLSLIGGVAKEVGENFDRFNWGFAAGGNIFFYLDDNLLLGARAAYTRWTPVDSQFLQSVGSLLDGKVSGENYTIEIVPFARLTTNFPMSMINLFAQAGAGLYIINSEVTVTGTGEDETEIQQIFGENARARFGAAIGGGLTFGNPEFISVDIYPIFNLIFLDKSEWMKYLTINLAIGFGI